MGGSDPPFPVGIRHCSESASKISPPPPPSLSDRVPGAATLKHRDGVKMYVRVLGSAPEARKPAASYKRRTPPGPAVSGPAGQTSPDRRTCHRPVSRTRRPCPRTRRNTTRPTTGTTTRTKTRVTSSPSARPRNPSPRRPIPEVTSRALTRTWTTSVTIYGCTILIPVLQYTIVH